VTEKSFYVVGHDLLVTKMLQKAGYSVSKKLDPRTCHGVVFTGGSDVTPFLYGERRLDVTSSNLGRDLAEIALFKTLPSKLPKIGICRGGQFLNVMSGGMLWQDVNNHALMGGHKAWIIEGPWAKAEIKVTSTHHQMMIPGDLGEILMVANLSTKKVGDGDVFELTPDQASRSYDDCEVVWYDHCKSLCFQPHPEYDNASPECTSYFFSLIEKYVLGKEDDVVH
jgi:hypothetical protein